MPKGSTGSARGGSSSNRSNSKKAPAKKPAKKEITAYSPRQKEIIGIMIMALALVLLISVAVAPPEGEQTGALGFISLFLLDVMRFFAGIAAISMPICLLLFGLVVFLGRNQVSNIGRLVGLGLLWWAVLALFSLQLPLSSFGEYMALGIDGFGGGALGALLSFLLQKGFGYAGSMIILIAMLVIGFMLFSDLSLRELIRLIAMAIYSFFARLIGNRDQKAAVIGNDAPPKTAAKKTLPPLKAKIITPEQAAPNITDSKEAVSLPPPKPNRFTNEFLPDISGGDPLAEQQEFDFAAAMAKADHPKSAAKPAAKPAPQEDFSDFDAHLEAIPAAISALNQDAELNQPAQAAAKIAAGQISISSYDQQDEAEDQSALPPEPVMPAGASPGVTSPAAAKAAAARVAAKAATSIEQQADDSFEQALNIDAQQENLDYQLPPIELLANVVKTRNPNLNKDIADSIALLEKTLHDFGVKAAVTQVVAGPAVTRYELQPAAGVKVAKITSLSDDIALALAATGVRIEAPIPGKSAIGIEIARSQIDIVHFKELAESANFKKNESNICFALGKNISGEAVVGDLSKMPHLLIAGSTGSGKSSCLNSIMCSILFKAKPDEVKLMLVDPKKVEMTYYEDLPHLAAPVVTDSKKAANMLKGVVTEMDNRYSLFAAERVKNFSGYNEKHPESKLPQIVVVIDELADLMLVAKNDVEQAICRIAQLARAAGIHLVVATQRPSVDVITGLIKANIPSRIAFAVSSYTDSRTILDTSGAEKLLGRGDMLYSPVGANKPIRIQGSFVDENDIANLVEYCKAQAKPQFSQQLTEAAVSVEKPIERGETLDELFYEAGEIIIMSGQASTSFLQRRLAIGNPRAARLVDALAEKGVVGGPKGAKPRDILMTMAEFEEIFGHAK